LKSDFILTLAVSYGDNVLCDYESARKGMLMTNKTIAKEDDKKIALVAHDMGVERIRVSQIANRLGAISVETTMRSACYCDSSASVWFRKAGSL